MKQPRTRTTTSTIHSKSAAQPSAVGAVCRDLDHTRSAGLAPALAAAFGDPKGRQEIAGGVSPR